MRIQDLQNKTVCLLGFGKEGRATLAAIRQYAPGAEVTIADKNTELQVANCKLQLGSNYMDDLDGFDVIIKSPGIPWNSQIATRKSQLTSATQIFFDSVAGTGAVIVGVTGSKGKSTTSSLIHAMLKAGGKRSALVGNIGEPSLNHLDEAKKGMIFVHELSSYQLQDMTVSPHVAVVTSIFPEHLDYHGSFAAYVDAKANIARFQKPEDIVIYPVRDRHALEIAAEGHGRKLPFTAEDAPVRVAETKLIGNHNQSNIAAAWHAAEQFGIDAETAAQAAKAFTPLAHRLQSLGIVQKIEWIDDAISTTADSAIAALDALGDRVATVILGGTDRGVPFEHLGKRIAASSVKTVILFPDTGVRIKKAIQDAGAKVSFFDAASMEEAVTIAARETPKTEPASIALLSTASPSYNMFKNFEEKGEQFKIAIMNAR